MTIGNKIKQLRKSKGYSQVDLAKLLNISSQAISKWESNSSSRILVVYLILLHYLG